MPEVIFNGPEGRLEGYYSHNEAANSPIAVVLHPHPLYGGTMNNKVTYRIFQSFARNGFSVLRFNFRGVGRSIGKFDDGIGEMSDAASALDWIQQQNPESSSCWIGGFSFGSWIAMQLLMRRPELEGFVAISPPANMYDFSFLSPCPASGFIAQGDKDDIVKMEDVEKLIVKLDSQKGCNVTSEIFSGADHYFRNSMEGLEDSMNKYIGERLISLRHEKSLRQDKKRRQLPHD